MGTARTVIVHVYSDPWGQPVVVVTDDFDFDTLKALLRILPTVHVPGFTFN